MRRCASRPRSRTLSLDNTLRFGQAATNAKLATDAALANAGAANQVNLTNAGYRQQAGLANQNAVNDIANQNAGRNLQAATVANTLDNNTYQRRAAASSSCSASAMQSAGVRAGRH